MVQSTPSPRPPRPPPSPTPAGSHGPADHILADVMEKSRSTWQMWHVRAEAQRQVRTVNLPPERASALVDLLVDEVLMCSVGGTRRTT